MQFGIFSIGDVTPDPTTGRAPSKAERMKAMVAIAEKAEEVGLDVFATGEHHNPPFVPSWPTTMLGFVAARTSRIIVSTATTLITTNDQLTVGSPQQVIEKTLSFREHFGDYQRQLFLADHAGLPLKTVFEQLDILGEEVVPVLRRELDALRPGHVPDGPTHQGLLQSREPAALETGTTDLVMQEASR